MGLTRLRGIDRDRIGAISGPLNGGAAAIEREFAREMERLGHGTPWCGESFARGAFAPGAIYLAVDGMH
jgi:hypothetical protein